jgi:hypothetical protein
MQGDSKKIWVSKLSGGVCMFDELMLHSDKLQYRNKYSNQVTMKIRLPWYRGLPISCIERVEVKIDGKEIPRDKTRLVVSGHEYRMCELAEMSETNWFVLDTAEVRLDPGSDLGQGMHDVSLAVKLRIPYGEPDYYDFDFSQLALCNKKMELVGREF